MNILGIPANIGEYLTYDETSSTGLRWIKKFCHKINISDEAGCLKTGCYHHTRFQGKIYRNHRIIFFLHHGYCSDCIDHIDGNKQNNKIDNLREATRSQNNQNQKLKKNNKTGIKGLSSWINQSGTEYWRCCIQGPLGKSTTFRKDLPNSFEIAKRWIIDNREELHGEFANNGDK